MREDDDEEPCQWRITIKDDDKERATMTAKDNDRRGKYGKMQTGDDDDERGWW